MGDDYRTNGGSIIVQMGDDYRTNGGSIIVQMGDGAKPQSSPICTIIIPHSPVDGHSLLPGRSLALVVLIITQMGDRHEVATLVDGHSIIVQMGDGAKPLPRRWPQLTTRAIPRPGSLHYYPNGGQARSGCTRRWP